MSLRFEQNWKWSKQTSLHFLCEVSPSGGSNHDGIFFISRDKPNLVSRGEVHAQKCIFLDVLIPEN